MADNRLSIGAEPYIKFETVTAVGERLVKRCDRIFRNGLSGTGSTMAEQERPMGTRAGHKPSVEIEVPDRLACVRGFLGLLQCLLELLLQQVRSVLLRLY